MSDPRPERPAMRAALDALDLPRRKPDDADAPPPSTFPMTPGARAAKAMHKRKGREQP